MAKREPEVRKRSAAQRAAIQRLAEALNISKEAVEKAGGKWRTPTRVVRAIEKGEGTTIARRVNARRIFRGANILKKRAEYESRAAKRRKISRTTA